MDGIYCVNTFIVNGTPMVAPPYSFLCLHTPFKSWPEYSQLLQTCSDGLESSGEQGSLYVLEWKVEKSALNDKVRELVHLVSGCHRGDSSVWLGVNEDRAPHLAARGGIFLGEAAAAELRGFMELLFVGELIEDDGNIPLYRLLEEGHVERERMVGRGQNFKESQEFANHLLSENEVGVLVIQGVSGVGKSMFARVLCSYLEEQWGVHEERYYSDNRGGDRFASVSSKGEDQGVRRNSLIRHVDAVKPCVWLIDDGHWMPKSDSDLISQLAGAAEGPALFLVTSRPEGEGAFVGENVKTLVLEDLDEEAVRELIRFHFGCDAADDVVEEVHAATNGFPILTDELISSWRQSQYLRVRQGQVVRSKEASSDRVRVGMAQLILNRLNKLGSEQAQVMSSLALIRGSLKVSELATVIEQLGASVSTEDLGIEDFFQYRDFQGELTLECRHDTVRNALVQSLGDSEFSAREAVLKFETERKNWEEVYYHSVQLGDAHKDVQEASLVKAFDRSWSLSKLEQCFEFGKDIREAELEQSGELEFRYRMGRICYLIGEMYESALWMEEAIASNRWLAVLGVAGHVCPWLRKMDSVKSRAQEATRVIDAYQVRADVLWNAKAYYQSAMSLIGAWVSGGMIQRPCGVRGEAIAGMSIIASALPIRPIRNRMIDNCLKEAVAANDTEREMRSRMLLSIALLGTERWAVAREIVHPSYEWAKQRGDIKLQLQSGVLMCASACYREERDEVMRLLDELTSSARFSSDRFLSKFTHCNYVYFVGAYDSNSRALRMLSEGDEPYEAIPEASALAASLYFGAGDFESSKLHAERATAFFAKTPPTNYGMTPLFECLSLAVAGLWGKGEIELAKVRKVAKAFKKHARAFVSAVPMCQAWSAVAGYCASSNKQDLERKLLAAMQSAVEQKNRSYQTTIWSLQDAFGFKPQGGGVVKAAELSRIQKMAGQLER